MLTKDDLTAIRNIVRSEVKEEVSPLKKDVTSLKNDVGTLKKDVNVLKKDVKSMKKDIETIVSFFDNETIGLSKRVDRIEKHLNMPPLN